MSTKTTFKRIALATVAALGFGVMTSVPSTAVDTATVVSSFTSSLSLSHTSATVVGYDNSAPTKSAAIFQMTAIGNNGQSAQIFSGETITATVVGVPAISGSNATPSTSDLLITPVKVGSSGFETAALGGSSLTTAALGTATISGATASVGSPDNARIAAGAQPTRPNSVYYFAVTPNEAANFVGKAVDAGTYTIRIRLTDTTGFSSSYNVTVNFVANAADSGAVITPTVTGRYLESASSMALTYTATRNMQATVANATSGRLYAAGATGFNPAAPVLSAALTTSAGVLRSESLTIADSGVAAVDHVAITTGTDATTTPVNAAVTAETKQAANVLLKTRDGVYGITSTSALAAPTATTGDLLRVRYGATSATVALTIVPLPAGTTTGTASFTATGKIAGTDAVTLPLTTTSVTFTNTVTDTASPYAIKTGYDVYYTLSYANCPVTADQTPLATTAPVKLVTDSAGQVSVTVTSRKTVATCAATVTWSGTTTVPAAQVATWAKPAAAVVSASTGSYQALTKSAHTITWTVADQFGAPVANEAVTFTASGANIPTAGLTSAVLDANGQVTFAWTDAAAVAASTTVGTTSISLGTIAGVTAPTNAAVVVTYKAALDVVASLKATYTDTVQVLVPTTNIGGTTGRLVSAADAIDTTKVVTVDTAVPHWVQLNFTPLTSALVAVTGIPTTVTVTGAQLIGANGKLTNSVVLYGSATTVNVLGTKTGVATVTATNGTLTSKATIKFINAAGDARVLSLKEANGLVTATVADAFGNGVAAITVDVTGTGGAWFGNGATSASFKTGTDGTVTFAITGAGTVTATLAVAAKSARVAGSNDADGISVTTGAPAGVDTASIASTGVVSAAEVAQAAQDAAAEAIDAGNNAYDAANAAADAADAATAAAQQAGEDAVAAAEAAGAAAVEAAQSAQDAAAEATDAATAATDAANAAAEAADAATAAAQDAADAVAALSTQVSEMVSALKKQITALTNLVIKIQKKVKA
jgi:hypothetical protein